MRGFFSLTFGNMRTLGLVFSGLFLCSTAWAADAQDALERFVKTRQFAEGRFTQTVVSRSGAVKQKGSGEFSFSRPGKFRWEIIKPYPQLILADGKTVVSYDPDMQHATQKPMGNALDSTPAALLFGSADLNRLFILKDEGSKNGKLWLLARPKDKETLFDFVRIGFSGDVPSNLEIHDALGQVTQLEFSGWDFDTKRPAGFFTFKPPAGVDLIQTQ